MKKYLPILAVIAALVACSKEIVSDEIQATPEEALTFTASMDKALTRTTLSDLGGGSYDIVWQTSDLIRVTDGTNNAVYKPTTAATQSSLSKYDGTEPTGPTFYAYYPNGYYNTSTGVFTLPEIRSSYSTGTFIGFPMYAQSDNTDLHFKNVCGLLELTLSGASESDRFGKVVLRANEYLSGPMSIVADGGAYKAEITSGSKSVTVGMSTTKKLSDGIVVYLPLPAGTYTDFTIEVYPSAAGDHYARKIANKNIVIVRSQVTPITISTIAFNVTPLSKGTGTSENPYQIESEDDIIALSEACRNGVSFTGKYLKVMNNITLTAAHKPFKLVCEELDGNNKTITLNSGYDLSVVQSSEPYAGFISSLTGTVKNLTLAGSDVSITAVESANVRSFGALLGYGGTVRGCHNTINIEWTSSRTESVAAAPLAMGGISGTYTHVYNSENTGNLTFTLTNVANPVSALGGIIGVSGGTISGCTNSGAIYGDGVRYTGGLLGGTDSSLSTVTLDRSSNSGAVTGIYKYSNSSYCIGMAGGIAGSVVKGTITNCANTGAVIGQHNTTGYSGPIFQAGGIVGKAALTNAVICIIKNCYNTADIIARTEYDNVGFKPFAAGISGSGGEISNCYTGGTIYTKAYSGGSYDNKAYGGGIIGYMWHDGSFTPAYQGGVSYSYFPSQALGGTTSNMRTIGYVSKDAKETTNVTTFYKGEDSGGTKFNASSLESVASTTINAVEYASGTDLVTLLNAGVAYIGGDLLTWKAGTGDPAYPVFN
ncbi:MAG: fimbrillin family protein [Bacteroidales bacterium]|nr:fimbrillin family protein [Bacteroidales bacterium]